jgi:hypothetical protein
MPVEKMSSFPEGLDQAPVLPSFTTRDDFAPVMRAVERSKMPTGLYGWGQFLYILTREPLKDGTTRWRLTRIDPRSDRIEGEVVVPSRANHLTVVPGPRAWAFIEKGPVKGFGRQDIPKILFVPSSRLEGATLPQTLCKAEELAK